MSEQEIEREAETFRKHAPLLYDLLLSHVLEWPSLSVDWVPLKGHAPHGESDCTRHRCMLGTQTDQDTENSVLIYDVLLPGLESTVDARVFQDESQREYGGYGDAKSKISLYQRVLHRGDVHRVRACPHDMNVLATLSSTGKAHVFDTRKLRLRPLKEDMPAPTHTLNAHTCDSYGLDWHPRIDNLLLTAGGDGYAHVFELSQMRKKEHQQVEPMASFQVRGGLNDAQWSTFCDSVFGVATEAGGAALFDTRADKNFAPSAASSGRNPARVCTTQKASNALAFSPFQEHLLLVSSGSSVELFDLRHSQAPLHSFAAHDADITSLQWSPHEPTMFASAAADRRCMLWDTARIGAAQSLEDAADGPPSLVFVHAGHGAAVNEAQWHPLEPLVLCSIGDDNAVQIWQPNMDVLDPELEDSDRSAQPASSAGDD